MNFRAGGKNIASRGLEDAFVMELSPETGEVLWSDVFAASQGNDRGQTICVDVQGSIFVGAGYEGTESVTPGEPKGPQRSLVVKYSDTRTKVWSKILPLPAAGVYRVLCDVGGGVVVASNRTLSKIAR